VILPEVNLVGQVVERRYRVEALIGQGSMGVVYRARHVMVGREVAIKVLHEHLVRDPSMVARFEREALVLARLHHKNLVHVIDVGETPARQRLMVLDLVRGERLSSIIASGPLGHERALNLLKQLLQGLAHAHAAGLVHRDLKPDNVIVERDPDGVEIPRIVDFGIAVPCARSGSPNGSGGSARRITETGLVLGTPAYMAPEQAHGGDPDPRTDLFALGVMAYEMLAGVQPFDGSGLDVIAANLSKDPPPIHERASGVAVDPLLEAFARRLMACDLAERFPSAEAALEALELIERDREAAAAAFGLVTDMDRAATVRLPCPVPPRRAGWPPRVAALLGCVVFLGAAALAFTLIAG
jgi:eukaryotic-like serine/threonine-protein kinase